MGWGSIDVPHFVVHATKDGYATKCYPNSPWSCGTYTWVPGTSPPVVPFTALPASVVGGVQHELTVGVVWSAGSGWWVLVQLDGGPPGWAGHFTAASFTGSMANGHAQTFQDGGEVYDASRASLVPMGNGATYSAGYGSAAYIHDTLACPLSGNCFSPVWMQLTGASASFNWWTNPTPPGSSSWNNYYYYGDVPGVFWGQNYGYQWSPIGDWAYGSYKGECGFGIQGNHSVGFPITGVTEYGWPSYRMHALLCGNASFSYPTSCYARSFDPGNNQGSTGAPDWDYGYAKADCRNSEYVSGIAQSTSGSVNTILCCPGSGAHQSCGPQIFYAQNSPGYYQNNAGDWDYGYYNGSCPTGQYVAGVSAVVAGSPNGGVPGAPHAIWCCTP
jgi:hypothetical protein